MIIKKRKNQAKLKCNCRRLRLKENYLYSRLPCWFFCLINHICKLFWHSNLNEPQKKNFVLIIIQLSEVDIQPSFELFELLIQMSSLFIHVANFKITIANLNSKFCIYYLKSCHFLNNWVSNFLEERSSIIRASSPYNFWMKNWNQEVRSGVSYYPTFHKT